MKRLIIITLAALALLAASGGTAGAFGDATCGSGDTGGHISSVQANQVYHDGVTVPLGWFMTYSFQNCGVGTTVEYILQSSVNSGVSWQTVNSWDHTVTSGEHSACGVDGGAFCQNTASTTNYGCTNDGRSYRLKVNSYNDTASRAWNPAGCNS